MNETPQDHKLLSSLISLVDYVLSSPNFDISGYNKNTDFFNAYNALSAMLKLIDNAQLSSKLHHTIRRTHSPSTYNYSESVSMSQALQLRAVPLGLSAKQQFKKDCKALKLYIKSTYNL